MRKTLAIVSTLFLGIHSVAGTFPEQRIYQFNIFGSDEACKTARSTHPEVNCYQYAKFSTNGDAFVLLTDMPNVGKYDVAGNKITVTFTLQADAPATMTFTLSSQQDSCVNEIDGHTWTRK